MDKVYSPRTSRKIQLYYAANFLYSKAFSHPQVVERLSEFESDHALVLSAADAAMKDRWREIFTIAQQMTAEGKNFQEIINAVQHLEPDAEVVDFICNLWYGIQALYAESMIESGGYIFEGARWTIISLIGVFFVFYADASIFSKIIWSISLVIAIIVWISGRFQKKLARQLAVILEKDFTNFSNLV